MNINVMYCTSSVITLSLHWKDYFCVHFECAIPKYIPFPLNSVEILILVAYMVAQNRLRYTIRVLGGIDITVCFDR